MRNSDVVVGKIYTVRVCGRICSVYLWGASVDGGWWGTNLKTGNHIRIKNARKLRERILDKRFT